jgi:transcriptional regulator with XRE-family HTH domain
MVYQAPQVIEFLGYNPYSFGESKVGDKVKSYRYLHGLSHKKFGNLVGVNASTIGSWEGAESSPNRKAIGKLQQLKIL